MLLCAPDLLVISQQWPSSDDALFTFSLPPSPVALRTATLAAASSRILRMYQAFPSVSSRPLARGIALALASLSVSAAAQTGSAPASVEPVVVTAAQRQQSISDVQAAVQVITASDLATYGGMSLTEALQLAVGVEARSNGANSTIAMRGLIANAGSPVLVLIDGMRRTGKYGTVNLNLLPLEAVERIEIVRGPMSALYGADASGGVINIITKSVFKAQPGSGSLRMTAGAIDDGQRETLTAGATLHAALGSSLHRVSVDLRRREAFRFNRSSFLADLGRIEEQILNYNGALPLAGGQQLTWTLEGLWQKDTAPGLLPASPPTRPQAIIFTGAERETRYYGDVRYRAPVGPGELTLEFAHGRSDASTTRSFPNIETTDYRQTELRARYALDAGAHHLIFGAGASKDDLDLSITSAGKRRKSYHALVQDEWKLPAGFKALLGLRYDDFSDFGDVTTPRASLAWSQGPITLRAGYGEAYRAPSAIELYSRFFRGRFLVVGDPNLRPERNRSTELAFAYATRDMSVDVTVFDSKVRDLIQTVLRPRLPSDPASVSQRSQYANVEQARLKGLEITGRWRVSSKLDAYLGYDYLDADNARTGARLTQRARANLRGSLRWREGPWQVDLRHRQWFDYYNTDPAIRGSAPFNSQMQHTDLRLSYFWRPNLELALGMDNLFDKRQPVNWSSTGATTDPPARFIYGSLRYRF